MAEGDILILRKDTTGKWVEKINVLSGFPLFLPTASITLASGGLLTLPAIPSATRSVITLTLGDLGNPNSLLLGFYLSTIADGDVPKTLPVFSVGQAFSTHGSVESGYGSIYMVLVNSDYTTTRRLAISYPTSGEVYGAAGTALPLGRTYSDIGVGVLAGYYSYAATGVFGINKKVQCESLWLTQSGASTILNIALYNADTTTSTAKDVKVAIIR